MSRRGRITDLVERIEIEERWKSGQTDRQIAEALQRPIVTVRKWRRRAQHQGRPGLSSQMGRPPGGALSQFPEQTRAVIEKKKSHPGWGPITILIELQKDPQFAGKKLPSRSRIAALLKQENLVRKHEHRRDLPQPKVEKIERPNQEWEMDAQGKINIPGLGSVSIINISDVFCRLKVGCLPCLNTIHPNSNDHQLILRRAFVVYGLPEIISVDHDTVFFDNQTSSPFPTCLHLWLLGLGVDVRFICKPPPFEHAIIERTHQTVDLQAIFGQDFSAISAVETVLTERIYFLNYDYPSRALGGQAPLQAYPQVLQSRRPYRLEWERDMISMQRIYDYLAQRRWFRRTSRVGMFSLGSQRYSAGTRHAEQTLEITLDAKTLEFVCLPEKGMPAFRLAVKGLTKEMLMGELDPLTAITPYQLSLPFTRQIWREILLCEDLTGTT